MSDIEHCPTCGTPVEVVSTDEGTSHYRDRSADERDALADALGRAHLELAKARALCGVLQHERDWLMRESGLEPPKGQ